MRRFAALAYMGTIAVACGGNTSGADGTGGTGTASPGGTGGAGTGGSGTGGIGGTGGSGTGATGGSGTGATGACWPTDPSCYAAGPGGPGAACLATVAGNPDDVQLRVSQLQMVAPATLAAPFMQDAIITKKVTSNRPQCFQNGDGQLNLLLEIKASSQTLTMGASPPQALFPQACYAHFIDAGLTVKSETLPAPLATDGTFSASLPVFVLPIYLGAALDNTMLWPLRQVRVAGTLSADHECIGSYRGGALQPASGCLPNQGELAWVNGGTLEANIVVAEADQTMINDLGYSLCVLLSGDVKAWRGPDGHCASAKGGALPQGDWCSTTDSAGGCANAWHFRAQFAASATAISGQCP